MLATCIIEPVEESDWVSPMVVQEKKQKDEIRICVDLRKLNDACVHDPFPTPFTNEVLDNVGGQEAYSFTDGFSGYHQIKIAPEDRSKTTFVTKWGCFQYTVMSFGLKNAPARPMVYNSLQSFSEFKADFHHVYIRARKDLAKMWHELPYLAIDDVIFAVLESWPPEWHAPASSVVEAEKSATQRKKEEAKLRMAQLVEKCRNEAATTKA